MNFLVKEDVKNVLRKYNVRLERKRNGIAENPIDFGSIAKWIFKVDNSTMEFILSDLDKKLPTNYIFNQCTIDDDGEEDSGINVKYVLTVKKIGVANEF